MTNKMLIKTIKCNDGTNRIIFKDEEGRSGRFLLEQDELMALIEMMYDLYEAPESPVDTIIEMKENNMAIMGFRKGVFNLD